MVYTIIMEIIRRNEGGEVNNLIEQNDHILCGNKTVY